VTDQLNGGIRFLQAQTHNFENEMMLCHTSCFLEDSGTLINYLNTVKTWLDSNPTDVVTLLLTNGDNVPMSTYSALFEQAGLDQYGFVPASNPLSMEEWPTLGDLISSGKRLVTFIGM